MQMIYKFQINSLTYKIWRIYSVNFQLRCISSWVDAKYHNTPPPRRRATLLALRIATLIHLPELSKSVSIQNYKIVYLSHLYEAKTQTFIILK